jgi:hypothetical protein
MKMHLSRLALFLPLAAGLGQTKQQNPPVKLSDITQGLANPHLVDVPELTELIKARSLSFDLTGSELGSILAAATKGNRDPDQVSALVLACIQTCQECRARLLSPMTKQELTALLRWGFRPAEILQEARVRGVQNIEISKASVEELRAAGAQDELISLLLPDDRMPVSAPGSDYTAFPLKREEYDITAQEGWLKVTIELPASSQNELLFKHNALFARTANGTYPTDLGCRFNKPAPTNTAAALVEWDSGLEELDQRNVSRGAAKLKPVIEYLTADKDPDGRNAFRIQIANREKKVQRYSFWLRWRTRMAGTGAGAAR